MTSFGHVLRTSSGGNFAEWVFAWDPKWTSPGKKFRSVMKKVCWHYFSMRAKWDEGKIHDGKIQQKTCIQRNKFNYLCCQLQIIVKDSKQLLRNAKAMSICDYFAVDSTSFNQTYFYISTAYEFFSKNVYFFAVSFGWRSDKYIFCFFGKSRIALHLNIEKKFYGYLMKDSFWQQFFAQNYRILIKSVVYSLYL